MITVLTGQSLKFKLGAAHATLALSAFMSGRKFVIGDVNPINKIIASNGTTDVVLINSLGATEQAEISSISVFNSDTINQVVTVNINDGTSDFVLFKATLAPNEKLEYKDGWRVITTTGAIKQSINQGANATTSGITAVVLGADVINNNATANTMQDVTGLSFTANNGKTYWFKFIIPYDAAVATTGSRWGVNASAGLASKLAFISEYTLTASTSTRNAQVQAFDSPATSNASSIVGNNVCIMEGYFTPTANCTFIARFASEISASAITAKAGAVLYYQQTN